jgi:hypothetical protein
MVKRSLLLFILIQTCVMAQLRTSANIVKGEWFAGKTLIDPKVGLIKLARVKHDSYGYGTFLSLNDSVNFKLYYSPMCGNDCIWNYEGKYSLDKTNKLGLKFNTYTQHGFCKSIKRSYKKGQMNFMFKVEAQGKDTLILTRISK